MKLSKIILPLTIILSFSINSNASRIKKDLLSSKENEMVTLINEKLIILDKLLIEAEIYKNESDPLMKKSFFNTPNLFLTKAKKRSEYVHTGIGSSVVYEKSSLGSSTLSKREMGKASADEFHGIRGRTMEHPFTYKFKKSKREAMQSQKYRNIFNLKMKRVIEATTSFSTNIHFVHLLSESIKDDLRKVKNKSYKQEISDLIDTAYLSKFETPTKELFKKSHELISLLSANDISEKFSDKIRHNSVKRWAVHSRMFLFTLSLKKDKLYKKKLYQSSVVLNDTFNSLQAKEGIELTQIPTYYDKEIDKDLKCIETAENIKYKGRICINPIDVDKDKYFKYGTFESRENSFIQINQEYFKSLIAIDDKLKIALQEYIKFLVLKVSSPMKTDSLDLEGGL